MGKAKVPAGAARVLIDELIAARRVLARAQARTAELAVSFADTRTAVDRQMINGLRHEGVDARYRAGSSPRTRSAWPAVRRSSLRNCCSR